MANRFKILSEDDLVQTSAVSLSGNVYSTSAVNSLVSDKLTKTSADTLYAPIGTSGTFVNYLPLSGGTLTGNLILNGLNATSAEKIFTIQVPNSLNNVSVDGLGRIFGRSLSLQGGISLSAATSASAIGVGFSNQDTGLFRGGLYSWNSDYGVAGLQNRLGIETNASTSGTSAGTVIATWTGTHDILMGSSLNKVVSRTDQTGKLTLNALATADNLLDLQNVSVSKFIVTSAGNVSAAGSVTGSSLVGNNLSASTLLQSNASKVVTSIPNGIGFSKNDGSGNISFDNSVLTSSNVKSVSSIDSSANVYSTSFINNFVAEEIEHSTGVVTWSSPYLSANTSAFNIGSMTGKIIDTWTVNGSSTIINVTYSGASNLVPAFLASSNNTYLLVTSAGTLSAIGTFPSGAQRRQGIYLGQIAHPNRTTIQNAVISPDIKTSTMSQTRDMFKAIGLINDSIIASPNGTNMAINTSHGYLHGLGFNWAIDNLDSCMININAQTSATFQYKTQITSASYSNQNVISAGFYDAGGVITAIPGAGNNQATNQRLYLAPSGLIRIQFGQNVYANMAAAIAGLDAETYVSNSALQQNLILIGTLTVRKGATNLSLSTDGIFIKASKFGEIGVGGTAGTSTTTLDQAYQNSSEPEISINNTALSLRNALSADSINVFEVQNIAGTTTFSVEGNGTVNVSTISASSNIDIFSPDVTIHGDIYQYSGADGFKFYDGTSTLAFQITSAGDISGSSTLRVGSIGFNDTGIIGGFGSTTAGYNQVVISNRSSATNASSDHVVTNNQATSASFYGDFGINSSTFTGAGSFNLPNASYLYASNGDLVLGTITGNALRFVVNNGATDSMTITSAGAITHLGAVTNNLTTVMTGAITATGTSTLSGAVTFSTTMTATGAATFSSTVTSTNTITGRQLAQTVQNSAATSGAISFALGSGAACYLTTALTASANITVSAPAVGSTSYIAFIQGASAQIVTLLMSGVTFKQTGTTTSTVGSLIIAAGSISTVNAAYKLSLYWPTATLCYVSIN